MSELGNKQIMSKNIRRLMNEHHKDRRDICNDLGFKYTTFTDWYNGNSYPRIDKIEILANYFGVTKADLVEPADKLEKKSYSIPVLGSVPAGIPIDAIEDIIDYEEIDSATASKGEYFGLKVKGHSMEPRICEGDVLIVKRQDDCESGDIAIIMINGNDATVKRLMKYADGIRLLPNNPAYEPMYFTNEEIISKPVKIIGKVVENRQKY